MTTPLQQAAQAIVNHWSGNPQPSDILTLRKALDAELQQAVEPVAWRKKRPDGGWSLLYQNVGWKDLSGFEPLYTHPAPPPAGDLASLISRAEASMTALNSRIMEPFYCSLDQDAARVLSDCIDMLEADAGWEQVARAQDAKLHAMVGNPGGIEKLREVLDKARAQQVAVPLGLALVPIEPTPEMIAAARDLVVHDTAYHGYRSVYKAMLAAAQGAKQ